MLIAASSSVSRMMPWKGKKMEKKKRDLLIGYKKRKIKLLNDFCIFDANVETFAACNTEKDIDKLAYELITKRLCSREG